MCPNPIYRSWQTWLNLESLEDRRLLAHIYSVGTGQTYTTPDQVPFSLLKPGDEVDIGPGVYHSKLDLTSSGTPDQPIIIRGLPDAQGHRPVLDARQAVENPDASYYYHDTAAIGLFTVEPAVASGGAPVHDVLIEDLDLENAGENVEFTAADHSLAYFAKGANGIALYRAQDITIARCAVHGNDQGIFGKSAGEPNGDLVNIHLLGNDIWDNGIVGNNHVHNIYVESFYTTYIGNHLGQLKPGAAGMNLKDRSVAPVVAYNYIEGGAHLLDLVDPDGGAPTMVHAPDYGSVYVYGNFLVDPVGGATTLVHFGFDQVAQDAQKVLYFYANTVVSYNSQAEGRWYTVALSITGGGTAYVSDNVFASVDPNGGYSGDWYLTTQVYGQGKVVVGANVLPPQARLTDETGVDVVDSEASLYADPGFVDALGGDYRLRPDSPALGAARGFYDGDQFLSLADAGLPPVDWQYDVATGRGLVRRSTDTDLGAWESDPLG